MLSADDAEQLARRVLEQRFAGADAGFAAGSIIRGEATPLSDLDLVVLYERLPNARRESFMFEGTPVEAFIQDGETLRWVMNADREAGKPGHISMVCEGRIVGPRQDGAQECQTSARAMMSRGPAALKTEQLDQFRYHITGRVEDLRDPRDADEVIATGAWLYAALAEFIPRANGAWAGTGKWIPRSLRALDAGLEGEFAKAFDALFAGRDPGPVIIFAEKALAPFGGLLFDGYESQMPASSRLAGSEPLPRDR